MQRTPTQANKLKLSTKNGFNRKKSGNDSVSTPLPSYVDSPPALGDSPSPIPFLCTQDESDVVWNYYSPTSENGSPTNTIDNTPRTRKRRKFYYKDFSPLTHIPMKKKMVRSNVKNTEFLKGLKEELTALNKNIQGRLDAKNNLKQSTENKKCPDFDEPLFETSINENDSNEKSVVASTPHISNSPTNRDFEDSMNEILIRATQSIEATVHTEVIGPKSGLTETFTRKLKMDSPKITNDSLDNLLGNMNDSDIELLASQVPQKSKNATSCTRKIASNKFTSYSVSNNSPHQRNTRSHTKLNNVTFDPAVWNDQTDSVLNNLTNVSSLGNNSVLNESKSKFLRHNSMPESPGRVHQMNKANFTGKTFTRHISMPVSGAKLVTNSEEFSEAIRCTPEDIKRKHEAAKERLMAKKLEPLAKKSPQAFYGHNNSNQRTFGSPGTNGTNISRGQPLKTVSTNNMQTRSDVSKSTCHNNNVIINKEPSTKLSLQEQIEKKRQDALMKLQRNRLVGIRKS